MPNFFPAVLIGLSLLCVSLSGPVAAIAQVPAATDTGPLLVLAPDAAALLEQVDGHLVGPSVSPFGALGQGDPDLIERLYEAGAWRVLDGAWIAALCGIKPA